MYNTNRTAVNVTAITSTIDTSVSDIFKLLTGAEPWRLGIAVITALLSYFFIRSILETILYTIAIRINRQARWIIDIRHYTLFYLSQLCFVLSIIANAIYLLEADPQGAPMLALYYMLSIPLVLTTFSLRIVIANIIVRYFKWERSTFSDDTRIFIVTESIKLLCFILCIVEIFYIFLLDSDWANFLLSVTFTLCVVSFIVAGYTFLKNIATGMFLIFAEPFRVGHFCQIVQFAGCIDNVSLARTTLRNDDGAIVFLPNGLFADYHQTTNTHRSIKHNRTIKIHPSTPIASIENVTKDLQKSLPAFAVPTDDFRVDKEMFSDSLLQNTGEEVDINSSNAELQNGKAMRIVLSAMYTIHICIFLDTMGKTLERTITDVTFEILKSLEKWQVLATEHN